MMLTRRGMLLCLGGAASCAAGVVVVANGQEAGQLSQMTPQQVHEAALAGQVLLVDVRRPDEWEATGIAEGAVPLDLRRDDFIEAVLLARTSPTQPVALICARGVRSRRMADRLNAAGIAPLIDIPEGMLGSRAGPGYLKSGLPVTPWNG
ncbi:MAG: rhodanese-like domain-containing protein [Pseudomonadota bacterium]